MATEPETAQDAAAVARAYFAAVTARDLDLMETFYAPGGSGEIHGLVELRVPGNYRDWFGALFRAFPDFEFEVLDLIAGEETVAVRWRATGTFSGDAPFEGLQPNGRTVDVQGCDVLRIADGRIQRNNAYMNGAEMARQLGALPPQGSPPERAITALLNLRTRAARRFGR